jgi:hypothetical protein
MESSRENEHSTQQRVMKEKTMAQEQKTTNNFEAGLAGRYLILLLILSLLILKVSMAYSYTRREAGELRLLRTASLQ